MQLGERWKRFWEQTGAQGSPIVTFNLLNEHYKEPRRYYHNWDHIAHCLDSLDGIPEQPSWVVEWALWFHDAVYDPRAQDNEQLSAGLAVSVAAEAGLSRLDELEALILATGHTEIGAGSLESRWVADIDLVILGESEPRFGAYEQSIRREYAFMPESRYRSGRARLLANFLHRPYIYATRYFRDRFEEQARRNLKRSLKKLMPEEDFS